MGFWVLGYMVVILGHIEMMENNLGTTIVYNRVYIGLYCDNEK